MMQHNFDDTSPTILTIYYQTPFVTFAVGHLLRSMCSIFAALVLLCAICVSIVFFLRLYLNTVIFFLPNHFYNTCISTVYDITFYLSQARGTTSI